MVWKTRRSLRYQSYIAKEKEAARHYGEALGWMGLGFHSEGHVCM